MFYVDVEKSLEDTFKKSEEYEEMTRTLFEKVHKNNPIVGDYELYYAMQCEEAFNDIVRFVKRLTSDDNEQINILNNYAYFAVNAFPEESDYIGYRFGKYIRTRKI